MGTQPEIVADFRCRVGEGPGWHAQERCLYWVDIPAGRLLRYTPTTGQSIAFELGEPVGGFTIQKDGALLLFMARGAVRLWHDTFLATIIEDISAEHDTRFNDVIADPVGRVFCGTMSSPVHAGRLYRLDNHGQLTVLLEGVGTSNGMGFSPDRSLFYHTDTRRQSIYAYDYDENTGAIKNPRVFAVVPKSEGAPDGLTVDTEGCVWSARWGGGCVVRYSPEGREILRVFLPAVKVSSLTFGGPDYTDIFITTAGGENRTENGPGAGALFRINLGIKGLPEYPSSIAVPDKPARW